MLQMVDQRRFKVRLAVLGFFFKAKKLQYHGLFEQVFGSLDQLAFFRKLTDTFLVTTQCEALVEASSPRAFEFSQRSVLGRGLDFVEATLVGIYNGEQQDMVSNKT